MKKHFPFLILTTILLTGCQLTEWKTGTGKGAPQSLSPAGSSLVMVKNNSARDVKMFHQLSITSLNEGMILYDNRVDLDFESSHDTIEHVGIWEMPPAGEVESGSEIYDEYSHLLYDYGTRPQHEVPIYRHYVFDADEAVNEENNPIEIAPRFTLFLDDNRSVMFEGSGDSTMNDGQNQFDIGSLVASTRCEPINDPLSEYSCYSPRADFSHFPAVVLIEITESEQVNVRIHHGESPSEVFEGYWNWSVSDKTEEHNAILTLPEDFIPSLEFTLNF